MDSDETIHYWPDVADHTAACGADMDAPYTYGSDRWEDVTHNACLAKRPRPTAAAMSLGDAQRRLRINAADLRRLADTFERIADDLGSVPSPGRRRAAEVAGEAIHAHAVWLMNAHLATAVQYAAESDLYRATGE